MVSRTRHMLGLLLGVAAVTSPAHAQDEVPHAALGTARAPVSLGAELTLASAISQDTQWAFAMVEGGFVLLDEPSKPRFSLNIRVPAGMVNVPAEERRAFVLQATDLELWILSWKKPGKATFHGGGLGLGGSPNTHLIFLEPTDAGGSLWGAYRGYVDAGMVDFDLSTRLGLATSTWVFGDVAVTALVDTTSPVVIAVGGLAGLGLLTDQWWLTGAIQLRPVENIEASLGCAVAVDHLDDAFPCRPYLLVGSWVPG